ncbi:MAG: efflux RND transporter periplasmic adaptor subunit [Verrucomicrobiota bacterium]
MKPASFAFLTALAVAFHAGAADVKTTRPARGEVVRYVALPGGIKADQQATLYAKVAGYLKSISVDIGDKVKAGQVLAEIEVPELEADLARYRASIARAEAEQARAKAAQARAKAEADIAALESQRLTKAQAKSPDLVVAQQVDEAKARNNAAKAAFNEAQAAERVATANVAEAKANMERVEALLGFAKVTAPFAGVITARFVDVGAFIPAATSGSTAQSAALVTIADFNKVRAHVAVPEVEASRVAVGQPVKVTVEGLAGKSFTGKVSRFAYSLHDASKSMLVEADLPNASAELRPGMYATIRVGVEKHSDVLTMPVEALVMEKANAFAYVDAGGKAKKTAIKIGFNDGARVEVASGLTPNDAVILVGKMPLADGQPINATEAR